MKKRTEDTDLNRYAQMGMAAMLPGMQLAVDFIQQKLDEMRAQLAMIQNGGPLKKSRVSPEGSAAISEAQKRRWAAQKADNDEARKAKLGEARKAYWAKKTPAQRRAEMKRRGMLGGGVKARAAKAKVVASFKGASIEEKWAMAREYRALRTLAEKSAWLKAHGASSSFVLRYREGGPKGPTKSAPVVKLQVAS